MMSDSITGHDWERLQTLFRNAASIANQRERARFLDAECRDDAALRRQVDALIAAHEEVVTSLSLQARQETSEEQFAIPPEMLASTSGHQAWEAGAQIGEYRIHRLIAEGGMGSVFEAEQENPRRTVALKTIRPSMLTRATLQRFEQEAHVLGRLQHAGIAAIHHAAIVESALGPQPFFVMEFVHGVPIVEYVREQNLDVQARLELLAKVCDAVHHAHQKGIIHRDLKPGNILVTENGQPKILDFGIARVTDSDLQVTTLETDVGQIIGTLSYMSPEQARGESDAIDTRSDVYSLGVIGYEILTGRRPYDVSNRAVHEAVAIIETTNPKPLSETSRVLRGDVETIITTAMAKDRSRRYQGALEFASDLRRYLNREPIVARPPSVMYQINRFAARHRALVGGLVGIALVVVIGTVLVAMYAVREYRARIQMSQAQMETEDVNTFFNDSILRAVDIEQYPQHRGITMHEVIQLAAEGLDRSPPTVPFIEATIRHSLGRSFHSLGDFRQAIRMMEQAYTIRKRDLGPTSTKTIEVARQLAGSYMAMSQDDDARQIMEELVAAIHEKTEPAEAEALTIGCRLTLAGALMNLSQHDDAEAMFREAIESNTRINGEYNEDNLNGHRNFSMMYFLTARNEEAEIHARRALEIANEVHDDPDHRGVLAARSHLATVLAATERVEEARETMEDILPRARDTLGEDHSATLFYLNQLAGIYRRLERFDDAERMYIESHARHREVYGMNHQQTLAPVNNLAVLYMNQERFTDAEPLYQEVLAACEEIFGEDHHNTLTVAWNLGKLYVEMRNLESAEPYLLRVYETRQRDLGESAAHSMQTRYWLYRIYFDFNRYDLAEPLVDKQVVLAEHAFGVDAHPYWIMQGDQARLYLMLEKYEQAELVARFVIEESTKLFGPNHTTPFGMQSVLASVLIETDRHDDAIALLDEVIPRMEEHLDPGKHAHLIAAALIGRGKAYRYKARFDESEESLLDAYELVKNHPKNVLYANRAIEALVNLYTDWDRPNEASKWSELRQ